MTVDEIIAKLKTLGTASYKKTMQNHGVPEPLFGVKIEELKKIQKLVKKDYQLALDLYDAGIYDAMYLAGLIADDARMTQRDLKSWATKSRCHAISEYTVAWVAAESPHGLKLALEWIESKKELNSTTGWSTLSSLVSIRPDDELDLPLLKQLLARVDKTIHDQPDRVRYVMNGFVIAVGSYVAPLTDAAIKVGEKVGKVEVDMNGTACKVPSAPEYIAKAAARGSIGKKRKTAKC